MYGPRADLVDFLATNATMILQSNFAKRNVSNVENTPPSVLPKSLVSRLSHRRRVRHGNLNKYVAEQAARRSRKQPPKQLKFNMTALPIPNIEMSDAAPVASSSNTVPVSLPKELARPAFKEVTREALLACSSTFTEVPAAYIRDAFEPFGPDALKSLASVRPEPVSPDRIPSEVQVRLECSSDESPLNPTHMLAIHGPPLPSNVPVSKRKVTLYPVHAHFLAIHCARLPPFLPFEDTLVNPGTPFKIPVRTICLPSPSTYARLSTYLYTMKTEALLSSLMPLPPPPGLLTPPIPVDGSYAVPLSSEEHRKLVKTYAYRVASTYTTQVILQHATLVHGLWQNICVLGIFDDGLWEVIDIAWQVLLAAIAVGTGSSIDIVLGEEELI
ncbi:hypothetical protein C0989_006560 [Termitomyces sp. Mn162]|nr:hypothetical protein C0989_006560 [Termitomyces sp. Mn162]KAH0581020.1 hypothetical protein H2248_012164 [Termitomyces sp. 'cryptogamus']